VALVFTFLTVASSVAGQLLLGSGMLAVGASPTQLLLLTHSLVLILRKP
jgi:hypothetical protein